MVTFPRDRGATRATPKVAYWPSAVSVPDRSPAIVVNSTSGQSAGRDLRGRWLRSERAVAERFDRDEGGSFSHPVILER